MSDVASSVGKSVSDATSSLGKSVSSATSSLGKSASNVTSSVASSIGTAATSVKDFMSKRNNVIMVVVVILAILLIVWVSNNNGSQENFPIQYYGGYQTEHFYAPDTSQSENEVKKLILFYRPDCPYCTDLMQSPDWKSVQSKEGLQIEMVDCKTQLDVASKYGITAVPTMMLKVGEQLIPYKGRDLNKFIDTNGQYAD